MFGIVYTRVANICLSEIYPYLKTNDRHAILESDDYEKVDAMSHASAHIHASTVALRQALEQQNCTLPPDFEEIMLTSHKPKLALADFLSEVIFRHDFDEIKKAQIACAMMTAEHELWIQQYPQLFMDRFLDDKYLYLPAEFIGYQRFMSYYAYVAEILRTVELCPEIRFIQLVYMNMQDGVKSREGISTKEDLMRYIDGYSDTLSPISTLSLSSNLTTIKAITESVAMRSPRLLTAS